MSQELFERYKNDPTDHEAGQKLLDLHGGFIKAQVNKWKGILPDPVIDAYGKKFALEAFKTYDPTQANINTHLYNHISQLSRMVYKAQNAVRIPESQIQMIGRVNQVRGLLTDELDREPTIAEVADHMHLPVQHIAKVIKNQRADFLNDSDTEMQFNYGEHDNATGNRIFAYRQSLAPQRQVQFDALTGFSGAKVLSPQQVGKKFNLKPYEVSRLKASFAKDLK